MDKYRLKFLRAPLDELGNETGGSAGEASQPAGVAEGGGAGAAPPAAAEENEFLKSLPPELQVNPSLGKFKTAADMAKSYVNLEHHLGGEKVPIPKDPNDQEGWDRFWKAAGKPEAPDKYEFEKPASMPEGVNYDENMEKWWRETAHHSNLSKQQAKSLYDAYASRLFSQADVSVNEAKRQAVACKVELQRDWGPEYGAKWAIANAAFDSAPESLRDKWKAAGLTRDAAHIQFLYSQRAMAMGETDPKLGDRGGEAIKTPEQIRAEIALFRTQHSAALNDGNHPDHAVRLVELTRLNELAFREPV